MKVALIGYGKMGKTIDQIASEKFIEVVARIDAKEHVTKEHVKDADVCIDFTHPDSVLANIGLVCDMGIDMVVGTTGWESHETAVKVLVEESGIGFLYSPNFSIGTHLFLRLATQAAALFDKVKDYDVAGLEIHHREKAESPSGTAQLIAQSLCKEIPAKDHPYYDRCAEAIDPNALHFASVRCGYQPGTHTLYFDSPSDTVELTLRARNREGLARGALDAAKWINKKKGFYTLDKMIESILKETGVSS